MKLRIWCDSGANIHSKREEIIGIGELGLTEKEWREMSDAEREEAVKPVALERLDWGFEEIE